MIKKTITYNTYDEPPRTITEDFYFNMDELEAAELELRTGGLEETIRRIGETNDAAKAYDLFKDILLKSVGRKSSDNKGFDKEDENGVPYARSFARSKACGKLIFELLGNPTYAATFVREILPEEMVNQTDDFNERMKAELEKAGYPQTEKTAQTISTATHDALEEARERAVEAPVAPQEMATAPAPAAQNNVLKPLKDYSKEELLALSDEAFDLVAGDRKKWSKKTLEIAFERKMRG